MGPQQQQLASGAYSDLLQPFNQQGFGDLFQKSFIDPSMQALQQQIIPGIKENFLGADESGSGALNRALSQSATDVSTGLGSQYMNFYNQQQQNKLGALSGLGGLTGARSFEPSEDKTQGLLGPLLSMLAQAGIGFAMGGPPGAIAGGLSGASGLANANTPQQQGSTASPAFTPRRPTGAVGGGGMAFGR